MSNTRKESQKTFLLSLLLCEFVGDGVFDGGTGTLVDDWIPERNLQEERHHQHQVCRVTQSHCNTPIILCCSGKHRKNIGKFVRKIVQIKEK